MKLNIKELIQSEEEYISYMRNAFMIKYHYDFNYENADCKSIIVYNILPAENKIP